MRSGKVIVAMPAYNEERYVGSMVLRASTYASEVIVVDDGSTDDTARVARFAGAIVVSHNKREGYGVAIQHIIAEAKERDVDVLVIIDADAQHNPDEIPALIKEIHNGYDIVIGSRYLQRYKIPHYRRVGHSILALFSMLLTGTKFSDTESGFRAFSRKALVGMCLKESGFAIENEMLAEAVRMKLRIAEVPISAIYHKEC